ncbi:MAG: hypothetical protein NC131_06155 [Roseburia sp.]|nr:hypothetical protein [Roseburia sp.]
MVTQKYYKTVSSSNPKSHWCLTLGSNNLLKSDGQELESLFRNTSGGILTIEGYLFPYTQYNKRGGSITHQGDIPINNRDFQCNARFLDLRDTIELLNLKDLMRVPLTEVLITPVYEKEMQDRLGYTPDNWKVIQVPRAAVEKVFNLKEA